MIIVYTHTVGGNPSIWEEVPDISTMCECLTAYRHMHGTERDKTVMQPFVVTSLDTVSPVMSMGGKAFYALTIDDADNSVLALANRNNGLFAIPLCRNIGTAQTRALHKLRIHDWVQRVGGISHVVEGGDSHNVYRLSPMAFAWYFKSQLPPDPPKVGDI